jgi:hypothetical protein
MINARKTGSGKKKCGFGPPEAAKRKENSAALS